jgi:hypothetical protein
MAGLDKASLPTYLLDSAAVAARNAEYAGTPFTDTTGDGTTGAPALGCNRAGACAPGIGINTGDVDPKVSDWTTLDQAGAARAPQDSQHIGGSGLGAGDATVEPVRADETAQQVVDINDTVAFVVADTQAADGAVMDSVTGAVNQTGKQVEIGQRAWGTIPVA